MKKAMIVLALALVLGLTALAIAHGPGWRGHGGWGYDQGCGPGYGYHMGPRWHHGPWREGRGYRPPDRREYRELQKPVHEQDAREILENYLSSSRNPNLKLGEIRDLGHAFEAEIVTKDDSLVDKILVDKRTGSMDSVY
jgi:hypothetical protein